MTTKILNGLYANDLEVTIDEQGEGRPVLLLHGGGGPPSMGPLPSALAEKFDVIAPVHPGFAGTPRPDWYVGIDDIALTYLQLLEQRDLETCWSSAHRSAARSPPRWPCESTVASLARCC